MGASETVRTAEGDLCRNPRHHLYADIRSGANDRNGEGVDSDAEVPVLTYC